jgi:hypothetical protein
MTHIDISFRHGGFVRLVQTEVELVLPDERASLPDVDFTAL